MTICRLIYTYTYTFMYIFMYILCIYYVNICVSVCVFVLNSYICPKSLETTSQAQAFPMPPRKIPIFLMSQCQSPQKNSKTHQNDHCLFQAFDGFDSWHTLQLRICIHILRRCNNKYLRELNLQQPMRLVCMCDSLWVIGIIGV